MSFLILPYLATLRLCGFALLFSFPVLAQTVSILTPDNAETSQRFSATFKDAISEKVKILDDSLSEAAYSSTTPLTPFNLTKEESKRIGSVIGCDFFVQLRSATLRRSAFRRSEYYESHAAIYVVSSRTGRLVFWKLPRFEDTKPEKASKKLDESAASLANEIVEAMRSATKNELLETSIAAMDEVPEENSPAAKNFRAPIPYRRIKPDYTADAALYDIAATVEILVDLDATGTIMRTEIVRWAGFGLDESVERAVRAMNWRPAERNGKPLPMRFLLRYNFKKVEKEQP